MDIELQLKLAENTPYFHHLGIEIVEAEKGFAKLKLDFKEHLCHPFGSLHGGAIASLADSAGMNSVLSLLDNEEKALTLEMKINYFQPVRDDTVFAEGKVIHRGKRVAVSDVDVKTAGGTLIAKAIVTCALF